MRCPSLVQLAASFGLAQDKVPICLLPNTFTLMPGGRALLKSGHSATSTPTLIVASAPIYLDKADILPAWPAYSPLLPLPLPPRLPWASTNPDLPTAGETREATLVLDRATRGGSAGAGQGAGEVWIKATRATAAFGPGDPVRLWIQVGSGGAQPVKVRALIPSTVLARRLTRACSVH